MFNKPEDMLQTIGLVATIIGDIRHYIELLEDIDKYDYSDYFNDNPEKVRYSKMVLIIIQTLKDKITELLSRID